MTISFRILNNPFLRRSLYTLSLSLAIVCQGLSSHAVDILDNTGSALSASNQLYATLTDRHAAVFTSLLNTTLTDMTIVPLIITGTIPITADFTVSLYNVGGGNNVPTGAALATSTITGVSITKTRSTATTADAVNLNLTTSSTGSWLLASGTNYAVALSSNNTNSAWAFTSVSPSTSNGIYLGRSLSNDAGVNWSVLQGTAPPWIKLTGSTTPVPEPSTYLLCGLATGVVAVVSKKRKLKKA